VKLNDAAKSSNSSSVLIVGGSLTGLTCALALARGGIASIVIERVDAANRSGGGLGVNRSLLRRVTGIDPMVDSPVPKLPVVLSYRESTSWLALHNWLRDNAMRETLITLREGEQVESVSWDDKAAHAQTDEGHILTGELLIGCDGYRSIVRTIVNPDKPEALYAGYMLWRGLVNERELPANTPWADEEDSFGFIDRSGYRLIAYPVPGVDGSLRPGERQVSFAWYDAHRDGLLRDAGCISGDGTVLRTLTSAMISRSVRDELHRIAATNWPEPWRSLVLHAVNGDALFGTPIAQYDPPAVARGRLAIAGDAAHVASPMTGRGFQTGVEDAAFVAEACRESLARRGVLDAATFLAYSGHRLPAARALASSSKEASRQYLQLAHSY
jgi:2-polyprenyl-6-methoxyphenol hydroxylase-like FAD-dependent oxidoreductase